MYDIDPVNHSKGDTNMLDSISRKALETVDHELCELLASVGWVHALNTGDPLTEWAGPRIFAAVDAARTALGCNPIPTRNAKVAS